MEVWPLIYSIQQTLIIVSVLIIIVSVPILSALYYYHRRNPILRARRPGWTLLNQFFITIGAITYGYDAWRHYPSCAQILFTNSVVAMVALDSHIIRCWLLLYNWNVSKALCALRSGESDFGTNWWLSNMHLASGKVMGQVMAALTLFHIGCWMMFIGINGWSESWGGPAGAAICTSPLLWFFGVWGALICLMSIAIFMSYQMRLVVDAFEIKNELMTTGGIWLVAPMPVWFISLLFPSLEQNQNFIIMLGLSVDLCAMRVIYLSLLKPLLMIANEARKNRPQSELDLVSVGMTSSESPGANHSPTIRARNPGQQVALRKMLDTNTGIASAFVEFLTKEFSVENWKFYSEVLQLRLAYGGWKYSDAGCSGLESGHLNWFHQQGAGILLLEARINRIYALYLARSAPFEINLSCERLTAIRNCFGPDSKLIHDRMEDIPLMFCHAQDEIYELMRNDSYERFKKSADFDQAQLALV